jgi:hypothetical protein
MHPDMTVPPIPIVIGEKRILDQHRFKRIFHHALGYKGMEPLIPVLQIWIDNRHQQAKQQSAEEQ